MSNGNSVIQDKGKAASYTTIKGKGSGFGKGKGSGKGKSRTQSANSAEVNAWDREDFERIEWEDTPSQEHPGAEAEETEYYWHKDKNE